MDKKIGEYNYAGHQYDIIQYPTGPMAVPTKTKTNARDFCYRALADWRAKSKMVRVLNHNWPDRTVELALQNVADAEKWEDFEQGDGFVKSHLPYVNWKRGQPLWVMGIISPAALKALSDFVAKASLDQPQS